MLLAVLLLASSAVATEFSACTNGVSPVELQVSGCDTGPCNFSIGSQVSAHVTFKVDHEITELTPSVTEQMVGCLTDIPLAQTDGCKSLLQASCPIEDGETVTYQLRFDIQSLNIKSPVVITFSMIDQKSVCVTCFIISGNIV